MDKLQLSPSSPEAHAETVPRRQRPRLSGPGLTIPRLFLGPAWAGGELCLGWRDEGWCGAGRQAEETQEHVCLGPEPQAQVMTQDKDRFLPPYPIVAQVEVRKESVFSLPPLSVREHQTYTPSVRPLWDTELSPSCEPRGISGE